MLKICVFLTAVFHSLLLAVPRNYAKKVYPETSVLIGMNKSFAAKLSIIIILNCFFILYNRIRPKSPVGALEAKG